MVVTPSAVQTQRPAAWRRTPVADVVDLLNDPAATLSRLYSTRDVLKLGGFPAVSGIFVAYTLAKGLALGDRLGFAAASVTVVIVGALLGTVALWFAGTVSMWTAPDEFTADEETENGHMFMLFSYATAPFLVLLLVVVPVDLYFHGAAVFSATTLPAPDAVTWLLRSLILIVISLWAVLMVRGTAAVRHESQGAAARDLMRWGAELIAIAVLFAVVVGASVMYW